MSNNIFSCDKQIIDLNSKDMFSIESFTSLQKFSQDKIDVKNKIIHDWPWISLDEISRNGSEYEATAFINAMNSQYIQELLHRGTWFGELDHPSPNCSRERFLTVDKDNINHRMMKYHNDHGTIVGDVQFVAPKGNAVSWDWVEKGINLSLSTRILTPNYEERQDSNGMPYIHKFGKMRLVTFDMISSAPGFKQASIIPNVDLYDASQENWKGIKLNWTAGRKKEEFKRLLASQESLPILEDIYQFNLKDTDNISYSEEGMIVIETKRAEGYSKSIRIPSNVYRINQVLGNQF